MTIIVRGGNLTIEQGSLTVSSESAYDALVLASGPIAYYKLDETGVGVMVDSSGNNNDGTHNSSNITYGATGLVSDGGDAVTYAGAADSYSHIAANIMDLATANSPKTIEFWMATTDTVGPLVVARHSVQGNQILGVYLGNNGLTSGNGRILCLTRDDNGLGLSQCNTAGTYNDGSTYHVVTTIDAAKNWLLYVNGSLVVTSSHTLGTSATMDAPRIGQDAQSAGGGPHGTLLGTVDNVAIYNTALSAPTILAHYNAGI